MLRSIGAVAYCSHSPNAGGDNGGQRPPMTPARQDTKGDVPQEGNPRRSSKRPRTFCRSGEHVQQGRSHGQRPVRGDTAVAGTDVTHGMPAACRPWAVARNAHNASARLCARGAGTSPPLTFRFTGGRSGGVPSVRCPHGETTGRSYPVSLDAENQQCGWEARQRPAKEVSAPRHKPTWAKRSRAK